MLKKGKRVANFQDEGTTPEDILKIDAKYWDLHME